MSTSTGITPRDRRPARWWWLLAGLALLLGAQHGNPDVGPLAWVYGIFLLRYTRHVSTLRGLLAMLVVHGIGAAVWVVSIELPADAFPWSAVIGAVALNAVLVLPFVLDRLVATRLREDHLVLSTLVYPTARVTAELLVATVSPFGIVFGFLAATQHENLPLLQVASVTGLYGVSFLVAWAAPAVVELWSTPRHWRAAALCAAMVTVVVTAGSLTMWAVPRSSPTVRVAGVTPSAEVEAPVADLPDPAEVVDGSPAALEETMEPVTTELLASTEREAIAGAEIVVWSEAATQTFEADVGDLYDRVGAIAREHGIHVLATVALYTPEAPHGRNVATLIGPDGEVVREYDKTHPLAGLEPIEPGDDEVPSVETAHGTLAAMICYDLDYDTAEVPADILLLPAADWEGFDRQHTQKAKLRAIEQGYAVVRQDAYGTAATYDHQGRTLASTDYYRTDQQTQVAEVPTSGRTTVYSSIGDVFAGACALTLVGLGALTVVLRRRQRQPAAGLPDSPAWTGSPEPR